MEYFSAKQFDWKKWDCDGQKVYVVMYKLRFGHFKLTVYIYADAKTKKRQ